jgi:hypothetical protein
MSADLATPDHGTGLVATRAASSAEAPSLQLLTVY